MTAPRGSARYFNGIFRDAVERARGIIDHAVDVLGHDGYPPLTVPITLRDLLKMTPEEATLTLRQELRRTMREDPVTGEKSPDRDVIKLATEYLARAGGGEPE